MSFGKNVGIITNKVLELTNTAAKKIEKYADNSVKENQNKNALKLSSAMKKLSKNIEKNKDRYVETAEKNADIIEENVKKIYNEMKTRVQAAKEKAQKDLEKKKAAAIANEKVEEAVVEETKETAVEETKEKTKTPSTNTPEPKTKKCCKKTNK